MKSYDVAIVGGGCVGLSTAKHLTELDASLDVAVLEKEYHLAEHQSGRNSGVLHPGFNYPPGSLKARFATEGTRRMKEYCRDHDVPVDEVGVVVVAKSDREERRLDDLAAQAERNGVEAEIVGRERLRELEPFAEGRSALHCPEAASVDSQQYVYSLAADAERAGADVYMGFEVDRADSHSQSGYVVRSDSGALHADFLVNAAGLYADRLAHQMGIGEEYTIVPFRGEYYELVPEASERVNSMIYPTPDPELPFLGVHFTRRTDGKVIIGPNAVLAFGREAYRNTDVDVRELTDTLRYSGFWRLMSEPKMVRVAWNELQKSYRKERFVEAARELVPDLKPDELVKSYAGIRAQVVSRDGTLVKEPVFDHREESLHVLNAVSPGLTSSLPLGEHLAREIVTEGVD